MAKKNYDELAQHVLENVGGVENIISVTHCITRLRFKLRDAGRANTEVIEKLPGVITVINANGQYHVVVGNKVEDVYQAFLKVSGLTGGGAVSATGDDLGEGKPLASRIIDLVSGIFSPILAPLCAAGIMKGLLALATFCWPAFANDGAYTLLYTAADGFFYFLPVALAFSAARKFGMSEYTAVAIGFALVYPTMTALTGGELLGSVELGFLGTFSWYATFFGLPIIMPAAGYTSSVIPILLMIAFAAAFERWVKSWIPASFKMFFTPLVVMVVSIVLGYLVIGPVATLITNLLSLFFQTLFGLPVIGNLLGCIAVSGFWMCLVIFGFHWSLIPLSIVNLSTLGYDYILVPQIGHSFALGAVVFAMYLKNRDPEFRSICLPAIISSFFFGVTEPAIYGVALPNKRAFINACLASVAGGLIIGFSGALEYMSGGLGVFNWLAFIDPTPGGVGITHMIWGIVASLVAAAVGFAIEFATYRPESREA